MTHTIIAFDPGGTTGWAKWSQDNMNKPRWSRGQLGPHEHHNELDQLLGLQQVQTYDIVYESFEFRQRARDNLVLMSKEYIGVIKRFHQERGGSLVAQTAAMGKGFVTDVVIKKLGLWFSGQPHAMDATRHLLYFMVNKADLPVAYKKELLAKGWK